MEMNRVKNKNLIDKICAGLEGSPGPKMCEKSEQKYEYRNKRVQN
jgi:hypothetical protein